MGDYGDIHIPEELSQRYSDLHVLGAGAMGEVFRAHDDILNIDVAIKVMKQKRIEPEVAIRFQKEAKAASKLKHTNLVTLLDFGISAKGQPYLIMENAKGISLDTVLSARGTLPLHAAVNIICQICDGMEHAHRNGIIHRDLKPSNVMVRGSNLNEATIKVLDFGVAKMDDTECGVTKTGAIIGTPNYMSPEQCSGETVDKRTDIYAAGTILFRMLSNQHPFEADTLIEIMQKKRNYDAPLISEILNNSECPKWIEAVLAKSLERDPNNRYSSMTEFKDALVDALDKANAEYLELQAALEPQLAPVPTEQDVQAIRTRLQLMIGAFGFLVVGMTIYVVQSLMPNPSTPSVTTSISDKSSLNAEFLSNPEDQFKREDKNVWMARGVINDKDLDWLARRAPADIEVLFLSSADASLAQTKITTAGWIAISKMNGLKRLSLALSSVDDDALKYISRLPRLEILDLTGTTVTDEGLKYLKNSAVREIFLHKTRITNNVFETLKTLPLVKLNLEETALNDEGLKQLCTIDGITWLNLANDNVTDEGMRYLGRMKNLQTLNLGRTNVGASGLKQLANLKLQSFNVEGDRKFNDGCLRLTVNQWPNLTTLVINETTVTNANIKMIATLRRVSTLGLNNLGLTDDDVECLIALPRLASLHLMSNNITDLSLQRLAKVKTLKLIETNRCQKVTEAGLKLLHKKIKVEDFFRGKQQDEAMSAGEFMNGDMKGLDD